MTEQERQAIESFEKIADKEYCLFDKGDTEYKYIKAGYIDGYKNALSERRKPSEDLVEEIKKCIESKKWRSMYHQRDMLDESDFHHVAKEIANLASFNQNAEINEAQDTEYRANRFIQALMDDDIVLDSVMQKKIGMIYMRVK